MPPCPAAGTRHSLSWSTRAGEAHGHGAQPPWGDAPCPQPSRTGSPCCCQPPSGAWPADAAQTHSQCPRRLLGHSRAPPGPCRSDRGEQSPVPACHAGPLPAQILTAAGSARSPGSRRDGFLGHSPARASGRERMIWHSHAHPAAPWGSCVTGVGAASRARQSGTSTGPGAAPAPAPPQAAPRGRAASAPRWCPGSAAPPGSSSTRRQHPWWQCTGLPPARAWHEPQLPAPQNGEQR